MDARDRAADIAIAERKLEDLRRAIERQDAQLLAAHSQLEPGSALTPPPGALQRLDELTTPPARVRCAPLPHVQDHAIRC